MGKASMAAAGMVAASHADGTIDMPMDGGSGEEIKRGENMDTQRVV